MRSTPARMGLSLVVVVIAAVTLLLVTIASMQSARSSAQTIGRTTSGAISADLDISFALADMDAQAANWLLVGRRALGSTEADAGAAYFKDRDIATKGLIAASFALADSDPGRGPVASVLRGLTTYHGYALQAELLADQGDRRAALAQYRVATDLMHGTLLPAMASLTDINVRSLEDSYDQEQRASIIGVILICVIGTALMITLLWTQFFLARRTHRFVNPALMLASLVALALTAGSIGALMGARNDTRAAKQDAFDSVVALAAARATAYDANSDKSRYLLDAFRSRQYEAAFLAKSLQIVGLRSDTTIATFDTNLQLQVQQSRLSPPGVFGGYLGTEFGNLSFAGEREAALDAMLAYQRYQQDDRSVRKLVAAGKLDDAITFATGVGHDQSDFHFHAFDAALERAITINLDQFDADVATTDDRLSWWNWLPFAGGGLILVLGTVGLWARIGEYRP